MLQATGADVGKSVLVAGRRRALTDRGSSVVPFKPQTMSNNAAVTADGGKIGRALERVVDSDALIALGIST